MGGVVGGLVGGLLGGSSGLVGGLLGGSSGLFGGIINSLSGGIISRLVNTFGLSDVAQAITNFAGDLLKTGLSGIIDSLPIPSFLKHMAKNAIFDAIENAQAEVSCLCQESVNEELGSSIHDIVQQILQMVKDRMEEEQGDASNGSGTSSKGAGNWLIILAKALGAKSGEHLKNMVELGEKMGSMNSEENPEAFAETQAEFQAETQIFKMFQESISTMIKSIGEGLSSVARKQ